MDFSHVSPNTYLLTEDNRTMGFKKYRYSDDEKPSPEVCKGKIKGVCLTYAFWGRQDIGIGSMASQFEATGKDGIINRIPENLEIVEESNVKAIKFGSYAKLDSDMIRGAMEAGVIGYWDDSNLIICASPEYSFVIDEIKEMIKPKQARFGFSKSFGGHYNLLILAI